METYEIIILIGIFSIIVFLINPVPYCKIAIDLNENNFFKMKGNSMFPTIKNNSYCICNPKENYNVNDIVVYFPKIGKEYIGVAHRIIKIDNGIYLKGDNNNFIEGPIKQENIYCSIPKVERFKPIFQLYYLEKYLK